MAREREDGGPVVTAGESLIEKIDEWRQQIIQEKQKTFQDVINFPNKLNAQFIYMLSSVDGAEPPLTEGERMRYEDLVAEWEALREEMESILDTDVPAFNEVYRQQDLPAILVPEPKIKKPPPVEGE